MGSQRVSKHQKCAPLGVCVQVRPTCVDHWKQLEQTTARWCLLIDICWFTSPRKSSSVYHGISTITPTVNLLHQIPMRFRFDLSIFPNKSSHKSQMLASSLVKKSQLKCRHHPWPSVSGTRSIQQEPQTGRDLTEISWDHPQLIGGSVGFKMSSHWRKIHGI